MATGSEGTSGSDTPPNNNVNNPPINEAMGENQIMRVQVKIPPFWKDQAVLWFAKIESQFITSGIVADSTKYHMIVSALDNQYALAIGDLLLTPPTVNMYATIKKRLIDEYSDSQQVKLKKMLQDISLGDSKPSQMLRKMYDLAKDMMSGDVIKTLWIERLSQTHPTVATILPLCNGDIFEIAKNADKMVEATASTPQVAEVAAKPIPSHSQTHTQAAKGIEMSPETQLIIAQIATLERAIREGNRGRSNSRNRGNSRNRSKSKDESDVCYYHRAFGRRARKCDPNVKCKYRPEN